MRTALEAVDAHIDYYEALRDTTLHRIRDIRDKYRAMHPNALLSLQEFNQQLEDAVIDSQSLPTDERRTRIQDADRFPRRVQVSTTVFTRNPDVIAEVLVRAAGRCEECGLDAPFIRASNRTPYLEVHHVVTLAEGGEDNPQNAVALCPNCHRDMHYG